MTACAQVLEHNLLVVLLQIFSGLLVGAMLPYWFSAMTMKSVGKAALAMVEEVRRQFATISGLMEGTARPDYRRCVEISTSVCYHLDVGEGHVTLHNCECVDCLVAWCEQGAMILLPIF